MLCKTGLQRETARKTKMAKSSISPGNPAQRCTGGRLCAEASYGILRMRMSLGGKASLPRDILARAFAGKAALERLRNSIAQMPNLYIQIKT